MTVRFPIIMKKAKAKIEKKKQIISSNLYAENNSLGEDLAMSCTSNYHQIGLN